MTLFELVKATLDEIYEQTQRRYGENADGEIKDRMDYLSQSYGDLLSPDRDPVDYSDPATRFAYAFKYVAAHGDYLVQLLGKVRRYFGDNLFSVEKVRLSCIGGGPGSDILAVVKYLADFADEERVRKLVVYLVDREQAWADTWTELDDSLNTDIDISTNFQPLDVTNPRSWLAQQKFLDADLFTLSYFVSEVISLDGDGTVSEFWQTLFSRAKPGALFLYIDNSSQAFGDYFDEAWQQADLECLVEGDNERWIPRGSEQSSELAFYRKKFDMQPKIQAYLSYRVLRKPI